LAGLQSRRWSSGSTYAAAAAMEMSDVIQAARLGDDFAFGQLVDHYRSAAHRVAEQIMRTEEAAADAVQEALIKAHRALPRFQDGNFRSWLLRIVTNTCYDHLRSQKRRAAVSLDDMTERAGFDPEAEDTQEGENPEWVVVQRESMEVLLKAIDELPPWHRTVVLVVDVHGYDYGEAADLLNLPLGTVKSRLSRARAALRSNLVKEGIVPDRHLQ
jgi:RNA polymerase sigma-70 factor (ECF subfamily)